MHGTVSRGQFGFTNLQVDLDAVLAWRDAAIADGWDHKPTYGSEAEDRACKLTKDGFIAQILTRKPVSLTRSTKWLAEAQVCAWGPDGLALRVPDVYDWEKIQAAVQRCHYCGTHPVKTERIGFAGRACAICAPIEWKKLPPNWCD